MGDMATFHKELQEQLENVNAAYLQILNPGAGSMLGQDTPVRAVGQQGQLVEDQETGNTG